MATADGDKSRSDLGLLGDVGSASRSAGTPGRGGNPKTRSASYRDVRRHHDNKPRYHHPDNKPRFQQYGKKENVHAGLKACAAATTLCVKMARASNLKSGTPSPRGSIFSNFETVQLSSEERLYLHASRLGDVMQLRDMFKSRSASDDLPSPKFNPNCVDYMGRNALHLAVDSEDVECIELLMYHVSWESTEEALLHAISKGSLNLVRLMVDNPVYMKIESQVQRSGKKDPFFRTEEKYQYSPDITPLTLAAHRNDHEMIQLFLSRGYNIDRPHAIHCQCEDCLRKQNTDSLKRSRSRLNAYRALSSPAYIALSSPDPIMSTFELRQEMRQVSQVEKEFMSEYLDLVDQCMDFACQMMDLCRGTGEVEAVLGEENTDVKDPLARLRMAIQYDEKKFVAHPNCQQYLTSIWYGREMGFLQSAPAWRKLLLVTMVMPALPVLCLAYIINPNTKVSKAMRCPVSKFLTHSISHFVFLLLLALATFRLDNARTHYSIHDDPSSVVTLLPDRSSLNPTAEERIDVQQNTLDNVLRSGKNSMTTVQLLIIFWVVGLTWIECKQIYFSGAREHFLQYYNYMDFGLLGLYMASYSLRFVSQYRVSQANAYFNATQRMTSILQNTDPKALTIAMESFMNETQQEGKYTYFLAASRFDWLPEDPEIVSDILFAVANVMSFGRTTYIMPAHELMGPLQVSLGRMLGDIARFIVLFLLVLFSFMVGMSNLYHSYGSLIIDEQNNTSAADAFQSLPSTLITLFFSIFGLVTLDKLSINVPEHHKNQHSTEMVDRVGYFMFAVYQVTVTIMLVNMLIAMMSHSFEAIQCDADVEWKFARTKLWMNYIDEGGTLPVPFNMVPSPKSLRYVHSFLCDLLKSDEEEPITYNFERRRENINLELESASTLLTKTTTYADTIQCLIRRYLFKVDRTKTEAEKMETGRPEDVTLSDSIDDKNALRPLVEEKPISPETTEKFILELPPEFSSGSDSPMEVTSPASAGIPRSASASEVMRELTRRATMKRASMKRGSNPRPPTGAAQLEAIHRSQKLLDARIQDLQLLSKNDEQAMHVNVSLVHKLAQENQNEMKTLTQVVLSLRDELRHNNQTLPWGPYSPRTPGSTPPISPGNRGVRVNSGSANMALEEDHSGVTARSAGSGLIINPRKDRKRSKSPEPV